MAIIILLISILGLILLCIELIPRATKENSEQTTSYFILFLVMTTLVVFVIIFISGLLIKTLLIRVDYKINEFCPDQNENNPTGSELEFVDM